MLGSPPNFNGTFSLIETVFNRDIKFIRTVLLSYALRPCPNLGFSHLHHLPMLRSTPNLNRTFFWILTTFNKNFQVHRILGGSVLFFWTRRQKRFRHFYGLFSTLPSSHPYNISSASFSRSKLPSVKNSCLWHFFWFRSMALPSHN